MHWTTTLVAVLTILCVTLLVAMWISTRTTRK